MAKISIIVPVYKVERYLRRCVDSILCQTFTEYDLILIDDGSPDKCGEICDEYAKRDDRVHIIHQENKGQEAARNVGIDWAFENSDSQWLMILDSDDWFHPQMVELLYSAVEKHGTSLSFCRYVKNDGPTDYFEHCPVFVMDSEQAFVDHNLFMTAVWGKCYKKELFSTIRYPVGRVSGDSFITHQLIFAAGQIAMVDAALYYYFDNPEGITNSIWTPRRMDAIIGREGQIAYFQNCGYHRAMKMAVRGYVGVLMEYIDRIQKSEWVGSKYERILRKKLAKALINNRDLYQFEGNEWRYEVAFPRIMILYWYGQAAKRKLKKWLKL